MSRTSNEHNQVSKRRDARPNRKRRRPRMDAAAHSSKLHKSGVSGNSAVAKPRNVGRDGRSARICKPRNRNKARSRARRAVKPPSRVRANRALEHNDRAFQREREQRQRLERRSARAMAEFAVICDQISRRKEQFIQRLLRNTRVEGPCLLWTGAPHSNGYASLDFRVPGDRRNHFRIGAHRLFLIMKLQRPIDVGMEAGHTEGCAHRLCLVHVAEQTRQDNLKDRNDRNYTSKKDDDIPF